MSKNQNSNADIENIDDLSLLVTEFYRRILPDPIVGYIFTDVAKIDIEQHIPLVVNFWADMLFEQKQYHGNVLRQHVELSKKLPLTPGHFTRWLYVFFSVVDQFFQGDNAMLVKRRAEMVANTISAALIQGKKSEMELTLDSIKTKD